MKRFACPRCGNEVHFDSMDCVSCGLALGLRTDGMTMTGRTETSSDTSLKPCRNIEIGACNWMVPAMDETGFCIACRHNRTVPDLGDESNRQSWRVLELGKRKLIYALHTWSLPHPTRAEDPTRGLAFDFLADTRNPDGSVTTIGTGHQNGIITLNLAEGDEVNRVARKHDLAEPYRTVIGHLRHEIAHYYWMLLVQNSFGLERFRGLFGDERQDYSQALQAHYASGPPAGWTQSHISAYATAHPWEDFAETWAHWMHIVDGLETAEAYGMGLSGDTDRSRQQPLGDVYRAQDVERLIDRWVPLTVAINNMNRGMGQPDLYPFVLSRPVVEKMQFINTLIQTGSTGSA